MQEVRDIDKVLGREKVDFFPELPKMEQEALMGLTIVIQAARVFNDWDSQFGTSAFALVKFTLDGKEATALLGGRVIVKHVNKLLAVPRGLPVRCMLNKMSSQYGREYFILDKPC